MYFVDLNLSDGGLKALKLVPLQVKNFRLCIPSASDFDLILQTLRRECHYHDQPLALVPKGSLW